MKYHAVLDRRYNETWLLYRTRLSLRPIEARRQEEHDLKTNENMEDING